MQPLDAIAEHALKVASKLHPEYAEAYVEHAYSQFYPVEQGKFNGGGFSEYTGVRIRIIKDKRLFTLSTNKPTGDELADLLGKYKKFKGMDTTFAPAPREKDSYKAQEKKSIDDADLLKDLNDLDKDINATGVVKYRSLYGWKGRSRTHFLNTEGTEITADMPSVGAFIMMSVVIGNEARQRTLQPGGTGGYELFNYTNLSKMVTQEISAIKEVVEKGVTLSDAALAKIKNVVIAPEITGIAVHESVGHPNEADRVFGRESAQAGLSYLTRDKLGMCIGSKEVTIIDNPTLPGTKGYYLYDDEGVRARPKTIVDRGYQSELLTNRAYAHELRTRSNGSARSDMFANEPLVRMSNTYVQKGTANFDELVSEAKDGIFMKNFMEWNIDDTRTFSRYQGNVAHTIKNGALDKPVKNFRLEKNTLDFWNAVSMRSNEFELWGATCGKGEPHQGAPVEMGGPSMLLNFNK